jgi:hypothetical protein
MFKDIFKSPEVVYIVTSAKRIRKFLHIHSRLHESMRKWVGGEIIQPNATRFGTMFVYLQSFMDKKVHFKMDGVLAEWRVE